MPNPTQRLAAPLALGVMLLTALVFAPGLGGGFVYDDYYLVQTNSTLASPGPLSTYLGTPLFAGAGTSDLYQWVPTGMQYWRPFVKLALLLQYRLFGLAPLGWHAVSLAVHLACVLFAFLWMRRRFASPSGNGSTAVLLAAALAAVFFAVHPSRVEAVAWVSGSADLWMGFWVLLGLLVWERGTRAAALWSGVCFALGFLSKETALVVPACLAIDIGARTAAAPVLGRASEAQPLGRRSQVVPWILATLPLVMAVVLRLALLPLPQAVHAGGPVAALLRGLACLGIYVGRVVWPMAPSTQIGLVSPDWTFDLPRWSIALGASVLAGIVILAVRWRRHPGARPWLADTAWFVLPLVPVLQFVPLGYTTLAAERFLYLPLLGAAALLGRAALAVMEARPALAPRRTLAVFVTGLVACAFLVVPTLRFQPAFASNVALWTYELRFQPHNPLLYLYLARAERDRGRLDAALVAARESYDHATRDDARTEAAVEWTTVRLEMVPSPGPELDRLCDFLDALAPGGAPVGSPVTLESFGSRLTVRISREFRERLEATSSFHSARAVANARAGRYAVAAATFQGLLAFDRTPATYANLVRAQACAEHWDDAVRSLAQGQQSYPRDSQLAALRPLVEQGKTLAAAPDSERTSRALEWAQLWLDLGAPSLIRRELGPLTSNPQATAYLALADALDGNISGALDRLAAARRQDPDHAALWNAAQSEVARMAAPAPPTQKSGVDALFR